jgi:hypothetical protein
MAVLFQHQYLKIQYEFIKIRSPNVAMLRLGCHESLPKIVAALQLRASSAVSGFILADGCNERDETC